MALVHYGLNFIDSGNLEDLNAAFFRINREDSINFSYYNPLSSSYLVPRFVDYRKIVGNLENFGRYNLDYENPFRILPPVFFFQSYLFKSIPPDNSSQLISLKRGSVDGEIEKIIRRIIKRFMGIISSSNLLLEENRDGDDATVRDYLQGAVIIWMPQTSAR